MMIRLMNMYILSFVTVCAVCIFAMVNINIGSININGARSDAKRASLFKLCELKKLDVLFVQETHSDSSNERDWRREWPGQVLPQSQTVQQCWGGNPSSPELSVLSLWSCTTSCLVMLSWSKHSDLTLDELHVALMSLANGKAPGIDGIPVEFYKAFWPVVGEDMLEVFQESFQSGFLPQSCRRAVITLLPKKGDLQDLKNWRPVSLLCRDYKVLSKALALRLREVMAEVVHVDQTYCVPGRNQWLTEDLMSAPSWVGAVAAKDLRTAGISTLGALMEHAGPDLQETAGLAAGLGWRSQRSVGRLLDHWRACLTGQERRMLGEYSRGQTAPCSDDPFPLPHHSAPAQTNRVSVEDIGLAVGEEGRAQQHQVGREDEQRRRPLPGSGEESRPGKPRHRLYETGVTVSTTCLCRLLYPVLPLTHEPAAHQSDPVQCVPPNLTEFLAESFDEP
ncbi:hypothetical protein L3Q82_015397 [Scortum barcoo]|uniref:Uncharacterized protein n=1 Tax=Scortum barcoo TaxID=214431 RepID=A0ACB8VTU8_9TELE|nr:hypothetical protein L3Q82_015397 [Scortum barcoo]